MHAGCWILGAALSAAPPPAPSAPPTLPGDPHGHGAQGDGAPASTDAAKDPESAVDEPLRTRVDFPLVAPPRESNGGGAVGAGPRTPPRTEDGDRRSAAARRLTLLDLRDPFAARERTRNSSGNAVMRLAYPDLKDPFQVRPTGSPRAFAHLALPGDIRDPFAPGLRDRRRIEHACRDGQAAATEQTDEGVPIQRPKTATKRGTPPCPPPGGVPDLRNPFPSP